MKEPELTAKILSWLQILRTRPYMVIPANSDSELLYESLAVYITGYLDGIGAATDKNLSTNIHRWHELQHGKSTSLPWHIAIRLLHEKASDKELCKLLLDDIKIYFKQNPNWQEAEDMPLRIWFEHMEDE
ncbi:hypothetical protein MUN82_05920 [Hymenobacter aerilatus]|uniref:Uncharacterized protein n=1 Tax=Hymenobacter aerilatus TaxID=2932251 RepID=A0A8T9T0Y4_9BACT|nr:hypothetical protein [Hymenobacter aerilatus]UOR06633.1 hypothetical protein MUN82_05920 [Hymenobacter aerilatus]